MLKTSLSSAVFLILLLTTVVTPSLAGQVSIPAAGNGLLAIKVTSLKEARFRSTIRQQFDFSCGSAALATLLTYHYDDAVSEQDVFKEMFDAGNKEKIRHEGFSLLDMKNYLEKSGYKAAGYRASLDKLAEIGVPAITLINVKGYKHFVVVKGVTANSVLLGDPAAGTRVMKRQEFDAVWNGLIFLLLNRTDVAKSRFNSNRDWQVLSKAPPGLALHQSELASVTMLLPGVLR